MGVHPFSPLLSSDSMQTLKCLLFLDLVFIWLSNGPMWFGCVHYCATETILARVCSCVCFCVKCVYECARVCVDARLSPAEEAQCVSVEVEGESRASFYKSGQITEAERPATPFYYPASSALCQPTHTPLILYGFVDTVPTLHCRIQ